jgi:hypothetical protein
MMTLDLILAIRKDEQAEQQVEYDLSNDGECYDQFSICVESAHSISSSEEGRQPLLYSPRAPADLSSFSSIFSPYP